MKTFLICPVRGYSADAHAEAVQALEAEGWSVHWPPRDTDQNDPVGLRICTDNARAIAGADAVHVIWDGKSQGVLFDLGVAFALKKRVIPFTLFDTGETTLDTIASWFNCKPMKTMRVLGRMVDADEIYRAGWTAGGESLWALRGVT